VLKLCFSFLDEEDDLPNPMRRVQRPTEEEMTIQPLTDNQLAALIDTCRGKDCYDRRDMALIRMWVSTPARLSEIALLRVVGADGEPDVDPLAGMIHVMGNRPTAAADGVEPEGVQGRDPLREGPRTPSQRVVAVLLVVAQEGTVHPVGHPPDDRAPRPRGRHRSRPSAPVPPHVRDDVPRSGGTESALMRQGGWRSRKVMERHTNTTADARSDRETRQLNIGDRV
jgi:integrase/recombinase XerC